MAQDDFLQFQERIKQAESRGRRYDEKGNLLTSPKGAQGEMQVMPATQTKPGFGVTPAKSRSPDEIARVGSDYLAAMERRYNGDRALATIAYNMGPGATDKWIAAGSDFSKLPAETQGYLRKVMGTTPAPATTQTKAEPAAAPQMMESALRSGMTASAGDLGSGYKAALALSFLGADEADKPETDDALQARLDKDDEAAAAELMAYQPKNAFKDLQLSATSHLKPVAHLASGGMPFTPSASVKGTAREELDAIKSQYDKFNADAAAYNEALNKYKAEVYDPYMLAVDKYNAAATAWNQGPRTTAFGMSAPTAPAEFGMAAPTAPKTSQADYDAMAQAAKQDVSNRQLALDIASDPERYGLTINKFFADGGDVVDSNMPTNPNPLAQNPAVMFADGGDVETPMLFSVPTYAETVSHEMYPGQGGQFDQKDAARHMLAAGTLARKYGPGVAEFLGKTHEVVTSPGRWIGSKLGISEMPVDYEQDLHNNKVGIELARRSKSQKDLEDLVNMEAERARNQQTSGAAWVGKPVRRADGSPEEGEIGAAFGNPNIQRQGAKARALAAQRDVNTLPDPRTYAAVSGFLGTPPDQQGFSVLHPDIAGIKQAGDVGYVAGLGAMAAPGVGAVRNLVGKGVTDSSKALQGLKDIPVGASIKPVEPIFQHLPTADAPFVGRLDEFVSGLQNPVRKDQFLGQLTGKFREYDIERAQRALADLPENAKLQPVELLNRLKQRYDPAAMRTTVHEPESLKYWANQDNPYQGQPVGVIHLSTHASPEQMARIAKMEDMDKVLWRLGRVDTDSQAAVPGMEIFRADPVANTQLDRIFAARQELINQIKPMSEAKELINDIRYPALSPRYGQLYEQIANEIRQTGEFPGFATVNNRVRDILIPQAESQLKALFGEVPLSERELKEMMTRKYGEDWAKQISRSEKDIQDMSREFRQYVSDNPNIFGAEVPYQGKGIHRSLNAPPNAASFTRFVEQQVRDPERGPLKGIHLLEIQSDLTSELKAGRDAGLKKHEVFPNMPENRRVVQQLGMKNAISAAINRGDQFVTFPGKESAKPQLYEGVRDNLKQVSKDLGPGFEVRPFTFKNAEGEDLQHWGITWGPEAAARIQKSGVPFKDGGAVERVTDDNRRYL